MTTVWPLLLHSGLAGHDWLLQLLVIALIAGVWLLAAGALERRAANRRQRQHSQTPHHRI
jgi:hypothetical protein